MAVEVSIMRHTAWILRNLEYRLAEIILVILALMIALFIIAPLAV